MKREQIGRSPAKIARYTKTKNCGECHVGQPEAFIITEFGKEPKAEIVCKNCGHCFESHNIWGAIGKWNQNSDPKIIAFPSSQTAN